MKSKRLFGICCFTIVNVFVGCSRAAVPPTTVLADPFPSVVGEDLSGKKVNIPEDFSGKPTLLLVGYEQKAQFDIDRWILGVLQAEIPVKIVEVPTIGGMMPQMVQGFISNGMRSGIPEEDWNTVVTVFGDADKIIKAIGNEKTNIAQVVLLDSSGKVAWRYAQGYSAGNILKLNEQVKALPNSIPGVIKVPTKSKLN